MPGRNRSRKNADFLFVYLEFCLTKYRFRKALTFIRVFGWYLFFIIMPVFVVLFNYASSVFGILVCVVPWGGLRKLHTVASTSFLYILGLRYVYLRCICCATYVNFSTILSKVLYFVCYMGVIRYNLCSWCMIWFQRSFCFSDPRRLVWR